jgi:hypothetical protein
LPQWKPKAVAGTNWTAATSSTYFGAQRSDLKKLTVRRLRDRTTSCLVGLISNLDQNTGCNGWDFRFFPQFL